ncbi:MAG: response regulator [Candidatus Omnitrophica bacterium]|nr:response regulator [Candidatus Omnitrophota bacterium]MDD5691290.1 response regulator [Candidatus Omnitrophota bacterium]
MKKKIMIIDDEESFALMLKMRIEASGDYEVTVSSEAKDIISRIHEIRPDVVLVDMLMPGTGGLDICDMLNHDPIGRAIPVIVVSGLDKPTDKIKAYKLGISDYLVKPVDDVKLIKAIEKAIKLKSGQF